MPTDSCSNCSLPPLRFRASLSRHSDSVAERHFNGKPELEHFRVACSASDSPDCERAEGESLKNGAQGGDRRLGDRDPT